MARQLIFGLIRISDAILSRWWKIRGLMLLKLYEVEYRGLPKFYGLPIISKNSDSTISIGTGVVLCSDSRFTALGVSRPVILRTTRTSAKIVIGNNSGLSGTVICSAVSVKIGNDCLIGADVQIFDNDFHKLDADNRRFDNDPKNISAAPIIIEDNTFIGSGSKILKGVTIGRNSVVGAGSIVTKSIPSNVIAAGNPAKIIAALK